MTGEHTVPRHVAIIMDGNGRWALEKGVPRTVGHRQGAERVKEIVRSAQQLGIEVLTLFAFSTENWRRPKSEVTMLMRYLFYFLDNQLPQMQRNGVRFLSIGRRAEPLPVSLQKKISSIEEKTRANKRLFLVLALNYGGRQEIVDAVKKFAREVACGKHAADDLDEERMSEYLYTAGLPDPDLLIRTSGEMRISNFLLWQLSYAELLFTKKYWPDFRRQDLEEAIEEYRRRKRRYGGLDVQTKNR